MAVFTPAAVGGKIPAGAVNALQAALPDAGFARSGSQSLANGGTAATVTTMNAGEFTTTPGFTVAAGVFTATIAGMFLASINALGATSAAGQYGSVTITHNATAYVCQVHSGSNASDQFGGSFTKLLKIAVGDTISFQIRQVSGAVQTVSYTVDCNYVATPIA